MINLDRKNFYLLVIFILMIFSFTIFLNISLIKEIEEDYKELIVQKQELYLFQKQIQEFESFKNKDGIYGSCLENIDKLFINKETPIEFIKFLEEKSQELGVLIKITPATISPRDNDLWENLGFQINLTGSFPRCIAFLEKVQLSKWLSDVEKLSINRISEKDIEMHKLENFLEGDVFFSVKLKVCIEEKNK